MGVRISHALIEIGLHPLQQSDPVMPLRAPVNTSFRRGGQAEATSPPCMLRLLPVISGLLLTMGTPPPGRAEPSMPLAQPHAANLARMRAESITGGLDSYRAAGCMYETGARACLVTELRRRIHLPIPWRSAWMGTAVATHTQPGDHCARLERWHQSPGGSLQRTDSMSSGVRPSSITGPQQFC